MLKRMMRFLSHLKTFKWHFISTRIRVGKKETIAAFCRRFHQNRRVCQIAQRKKNRQQKMYDFYSNHFQVNRLQANGMEWNEQHIISLNLVTIKFRNCALMECWYNAKNCLLPNRPMATSLAGTHSTRVFDRTNEWNKNRFMFVVW